MAKYRIGTSADHWSFEAAYNHCENGAIFELEKNYNLNFSSAPFECRKSITIRGSIEDTAEGRVYFNNVSGGIMVLDGAIVTLENLWFQVLDNTNALSVKDKSQAIVRQSIFKVTQVKSNTYFVFGARNSTIVFEQTHTRSDNNRNNQGISVTDFSTFEATNSDLTTKLNADKKSTLKLTNVRMENYEGNTIALYDSSLELQKSVICGGNGENKYPMVWVQNSHATVTGSTLSSEKGADALYAFDRSHVTLRSSDLRSISSYMSLLDVDDVTIHDTIELSQLSYLRLEGSMTILGENPQKIMVYADMSSSLIGGTITFKQVATPLFRFVDGSTLMVTHIEGVDGTLSSEYLDFRDSSTYHISANQSTTAQPVQHHESPSQEGATNHYDALQQLIGLDRVKKEVDTMIGTVEYNRRRTEAGLTPLEQSLHALFLGNPGTGKTTVARLIGKILYEKGALKGEQFKFVEVDASDLLSGYVNQTAEQTKAKLEEALGGVLFIDEAYALHKKGTNDTGAEAVTTILKFMEDHRNEIMVIFAGYTKEMEQFLTINPGLKSRVPNIFTFDDYTPDQIVQMGLANFAHDQFEVADVDYYTRQVKKEYQASLDNSNGRWIRNFNEKVKKAVSYRVINTPNVALTEISVVTNADIDAVLSSGRYQEDGHSKDAMVELQSLIGLRKVKEQVEEFIAQAELNRKREEAGHATSQATLHSLFLGNPGTGKTTVARIIGELLYQKGLIATNKFYEVSRGDLIGGFQGQTAEKTREHLNAALGGVLFIDEAYALKHGSGDTYGQEAIDEILKFMEDHRRDIVVIFAGYYKEMQDFLQTNSGLTSRVPNVFDFEDYTPDEIVQIGKLELTAKGYQFEESAYETSVKRAYAVTNDASNGRWARNFNQKLLGQMSRRVNKNDEADVNLIVQADFDKTLEVLIGPTIVDDDGFVQPS